MSVPSNFKQILSLSSTTATPLISASYSADDTWGTIGFGFGNWPDKSFVFVKAVRGASGAALTAVKFEINGSVDIDTPAWVVIPAYLSTEAAAGTYAAENSVTVSANSTAWDALISDKISQYPLIRIRAKSVTNNAATGDSCAAYIRIR